MMSPTSSEQSLKLALRLFGVLFVIGFYPLTVIWPSGWAWQPAQPAYLQMIMGIYATLGVFLFRAARAPARNLGLIWFTVWSSVVHAGIMAIHAFMDPGQMSHLWGDVPALLLIAVVLGVLVRNASRSSDAAGATSSGLARA
jgi:uncharacterized protein DUF6632